MSDKQRTAVVTGGNRGMGLATCRALAERGYRVMLTSRQPAAGQAAADALRAEGLPVAFHVLDVTDEASVRQLRQDLAAEWGTPDVLVNNAAIYPDEGRSVLDVSPDDFHTTFDTNVYGPLRLCQAFVPGMLQQGYGRVVNVSSGSGRLSTMRNHAPSYAASKAALNAITRLVADAARGSNVLVNAVDPGWVQTDMGGPGAPRSIAQGIDTIVWLACLPDGGPTGGFFFERQPVIW